MSIPSRRTARRRVPLVLTAVLAAVALVGCTAEAPTEDEPREFIMATTFGGIFADYSFYIAAQAVPQKQAVYDYMLHINPDTSEFEPWIATEWTYDDSRTVLSLTIRDDVSFTDGTPLDAEAVQANFQHRIDTADSQFNYSNVDSIEVTGDYTLDVRLKVADEGFVNAVAGTPLAAPASIEDPDTFATNPITSGPYLIDEANSIPDSEWAYVRNEDYWNAEAYPFDTVVIKLMPDVAARVNALISGQIHYGQIDVGSVETVEGAGLNLLQTNSTSQTLMIADRAGDLVPALADVRVRQAMNLAIDREAIAEQINLGYGDPTDQIWLEGWPYHVEDDGKYPYDPERAKGLLAEAGYADGFDLVMPSRDPAYEPVVTQYLADIGIRATFEQHPDRAVVDQMMQNGETPAYLINDLFYNTLKNMIEPNGVWNGTRYTTPELDALLTTINTGSDEEALEAKAALGQYIYDEAWFIQLAHPATFFGLASDLEGTPSQALGLFGAFLWDIHPAD